MCEARAERYSGVGTIVVVDLLSRATVVVSSRPGVMVAALVGHKDRVDLTSHLTYFQYDHLSLA